MSSLEVRIDDRLRLAGVLLAAGHWPEREQATQAYKPHRVAAAAQRYFAAQREHPAVLTAQAIAGPMAGPGVDQLFRFALSGWPEGFASLVSDFASAAQPEAFWVETASEWQTAHRELSAVMAQAGLEHFLADLAGGVDNRLVCVPNLLYPGRRAVVVAGENEMVLCQPPPPAWGTSLPWRYSERPDEVLSTAAEACARSILEREVSQVQLGPAALAAAVLFLREGEDPAAGEQLMLMEKKARGLPHLPALVDALGEALRLRRAGQPVSLSAVISHSGQ